MLLSLNDLKNMPTLDLEGLGYRTLRQNEQNQLLLQAIHQELQNRETNQAPQVLNGLTQEKSSQTSQLK